MPNERKSPWNSLEIAKLCAGLLTPILIAFFGFLIQQQLAEQNRSWQSQQRLANQRLQVYNGVRNELNRIFCFIEDVGSWKEDNPETVIGYKRTIDRVMYTNRAIWSPDTFQAYVDYMNSAFQTYQGVGADAKLRTTDLEKKVGIPGWNVDWSGRLTGVRDTEHKKRYDKLIDLMSRDLLLRTPSAS